jgi:predicted TIM-barrel fold metal-dependent hydrolase
MREPKPNNHPLAPTFDVPKGACDAHFHIFPPIFEVPLAPDAQYEPVVATNDDYLKMAQAIGMARGVLVQPTVYGTDNSLLMRMLAENPQYRGIAVVEPDAPVVDLRRLSKMGVQGIRMSGMPRGNGAHEYLRAMGRIATEFGWHIQAFVGARTLMMIAATLKSLPVTIVFDHFAGLHPRQSNPCPERSALESLLETGRTWVKLSGIYRSSIAGPPYYDMNGVAAWLIRTAPDRLVWGTDWPHSHMRGRPMPNDGSLLNLLAEQAATDELRRAILVDNPAKLYGFGD